MNYRHAYHAGNAADVLKHAVLAACLTYLNAKDTPWRFIDTHAGTGLYDLTADEAERTGEHVEGIVRLRAAPPSPALDWMRPYREAVDQLNPDGRLTLYPGSPHLAQGFARADDRLALCEIHPEDAERLAATFARDRRVKIIPHSGWNAPKAFCPPPEKRGLVLIDPPFEDRNEFDRMAKARETLHQRWPGGTALLWYPIKESGEHLPFTRWVRETGDEKTQIAELITKPTATRGLLGSGLVMINAPYWLPAAMEAGGAALLAALQAPQGRFTLRSA